MARKTCNESPDTCFIGPYKRIAKYMLVAGVVIYLIYAVTNVSIERSNASKVYTTDRSSWPNNSPRREETYQQHHSQQKIQHTLIPKSSPPPSTRDSGKCPTIKRCHPHQHVYYLKTHKTGSTTMYSIFAEYSRVHDLLPLMPRSVHINQQPPVRNSQLLLPQNASLHNQKFDMVFNHHVYSSSIFKHLHNDTICITTIREPFKHFMSSWTYFKGHGIPYLRRIRGDDPLMEFLTHRSIYEAKRRYSSYTNNRQSMDLGYDIRHSFNDTEYISRFISETDKRFDLVLITDYFHESLVIMKRHLRWKTQDILYFSKLRQRKKITQAKKVEVKELAYKKLHSTFSQADSALYSYFVRKFKDRMKKEDGLREEVEEFQAILEKVRIFCDSEAERGLTLYIPPGKWSDAISLLPYKCKWLKLSEVPFTTYLKKRQSDVLSFH